MTPTILRWVESLELKGRTLDVGSMDINGCVRQFCADYVGVDMRPGENVDLVANAHVLPFKNESFDNVLCMEMLEHDDLPFHSVSEMRRVLKCGGLFLMTARGINFPKHDHPHDYWRFTPEAMAVLCRGMTDIKTYEEPGGLGVWVTARKS